MSDLSKLKVSELQLKLSQAGLPTQGKKSDLIERLQQHLSDAAAVKFPGFDAEFAAKLAAADVSEHWQAILGLAGAILTAETSL